MPTTRACPECSAVVEVLDGYPAWCEACGWNVRAPDPQQWGYGTRFDAAMAWAGRRSGERLSRRLLAAEDLRPRWTPARLAAHGIALLLVATSFGFMGLAVAMVVIGRLNLLALLLAALIFGIGWLLRPRLLKLDRSHEVTAAQAPELHALARDVAAALGVRPPNVLLIEPEYNAWWAQTGLRRRRVLMLGAGLLAVLEPDELAALVGHELGHERNRDMREGLIVGSAVRGLADLYDVLAPPGQWIAGADPYADAAAPLARALQKLASMPVLGLLLLEASLMLGDSRRAEFLADELAAQVAGTASTVALHERLLLASAYALAVQREAHAPASPGLFGRLREAVDSVPEREAARRRAVARLETARLDLTHPPTGMRIAMLEQRPPQKGTVWLDGGRRARLEAEIAALEPRLATAILDRERDRHYYG